MSNRKHRDNQEICARKVRELAQAGVNKHCFECSQPGVTYIDITVGCFVCTSCSGMLRGLNPPHRVKSISMTTFSQQEVEFLQNHGNEVGRRTWLCVFEPKTDGCFDTRDSQKLKEFLQDKYEKKKWHFSKNKCRREVEGPWSPPGVQALPSSHGPPPAQAPSHTMLPSARRTLSQSQLSSRVPAISPADMKAEVFTARAPSRSQSFRDPPMKESLLRGIERQRPGSLSSAMGPQSHAPSFPALPRPSAPPGGLPQYSTLFGNRLSSSSTPASSPGVDAVSGSQTFANFPNPFSSSSSSQQQQPALSPSNPFNSSTSGGDSSGFVSSPTSVFLPSTTFPTPATQNAFPHKHANNQEANGFASFPAPDSQPKVPRPMSVNPFTGNVYPGRGTSRNPFI
ncbi:arf-GAP domain and FG repeat-containing protein 2-like isoform X2 [Coregonus clupeaformis]|uniref:arf-GAP domain and FG repeat-containing protein 2-like isoform X2 n=1 Tax=Coregonus clupeaformis TaxID=59861 RepID=UPI001E1C9506|nr:arf-GAP domain and FG repeat-containing protein 2-like isoform X2 [Coregonus clupeaformis]